MASPRLETFCCPNRDAATEFAVSFQPVLFGALSLGSAALSLVFAVLQVLPKRKGYRRLGQYPLPRPASSSRVLFIISICDILGCTGIIVRSSVWLGLPSIVEGISVTNNTDVLPEAFCVGSAMWIQLFFSASFWWTFCYAVDFFLVVKTSAGISTIVLYHMITWGLAVLLCVEGVAMLYYPSISDCEQGLQHAVPHYITTYAPMLLVLIANPVFFSRTVSAVTSLLKGRQGIYTENERRLANEIKIRFFKIMLVFFVCWAPNIINECLLFYLEMQPNITDNSLRNTRNAALTTWFIMGILNPMQAFLNTLAFHGWTGWDVDLNPQRNRELAWDSGSTSVPNAAGQNPVVGTTLLYQSHVQEVQKNTIGNGQQHSDAISVLSEGSESSTVEIHISSELQGDVDADGESLENSVRH
ncbi:PREDICTED: G-protein coupled receptor 143 [Poecilia mexicana]|uniref:G-protein coupled receptor 143 n=1 Tax=Poecilia mexicana TaxID=48701 RepID=A0A3B3Y6X7_9TELE|nr:PREDICTED: G-protein coupled receptor 143 [Poecilia mexicana]XP_014845972.1 PREDICTED: G-protein coupled receptor 143 [Poecilia mexicana]